MKTINRVELKGLVGQEPRVNTVEGRTVANFSVATDNSWKSKSGEWMRETDWHNVCAWSGYGVADAERLHAGTKVHIIGRLRTRKYMTQQGTEAYVTEVLAEELDIIDEPNPSTQGQSQGGYSQRPASRRSGGDEDF